MIRTGLITAIALLLWGAAGCASSDAEPTASSQNQGTALGVSAPHEDDGDEAVALADCPAAVRATIVGHLDGGTITELERTTDHGEVLYEVDVRGADGVVEFDVAEDGTFRGYENDGEDEDGDDDAEDDGDDDEEEIPLAEVPDHIKRAAVAAVPGLILEEAEIEHEGDAVVYELEGTAGGETYEVELSADGEVLEIETGEDDDEDADTDD